MHENAVKTPLLRYFLATALLLISTLASAQQLSLIQVVEDFVRTQTLGLPGKISFSVTPPDNRTQLASCQAYAPFIPPGSKLWGKSTVGVRCQGPAQWTIYIPVTISVYGDFLVSTRGLPSGATLSPDDITTRRGDLTLLPSSILSDPSQAVGRRLRVSILSNQPIRNDVLLANWIVQQGQTVRVVSNGPGFSVSSEGKALNNAMEGQLVQVRTASGQTISGIARNGGIVEISM